MIIRQRYPLIVWYAIILHFCWAVSLSADASAQNVTALHTLTHYSSRPVAIVGLFAVAGLAAATAWLRHTVWASMLMLPQQIVLYISAVGAAQAMWLSQFADGVTRPHWFLIADQLPAVIVAIIHTVAILDIAREAQQNGHRFWR